MIFASRRMFQDTGEVTRLALSGVEPTFNPASAAVLWQQKQKRYFQHESGTLLAGHPHRFFDPKYIIFPKPQHQHILPLCDIS